MPTTSRATALIASIAAAATLAGCGSTPAKQQSQTAATNPKLCKTANDYAWMVGYSDGRYGGPPYSAEAEGRLLDVIMSEVGTLRSMVPASEKKTLAGVTARWSYAQRYQRPRGYALTKAQQKYMLAHLPSSSANSLRFDRWLHDQCAKPGQTWPKRPTRLARQVIQGTVS